MKTLIVTGGTGGLGHVVVERLQRDYRCLLLTREQADLSDAEQVTRAVAAIDGPLYGLVHLVGGFAAGDDAQTWTSMVALNLTPLVNVARAIVPRLREAGEGRVVAISSIATLTKAAGFSAYTTSKAAVNAFIEALGVELEGSGVTANALLPDTLTDALRPRVAETIVFLLSDAGASVSGALLPLR